MINFYDKLGFRFKNPCQEYVLLDYNDGSVIDPYYPCIKYKSPADPKYDGTDYFIVAESMHLNWENFQGEYFDCSLSFSCKNDQKAFYKLIEDCLQF